MSQFRKGLLHCVPLGFLLLFGSWIWWLDQPPDVLPIDASPMEFSAERAMAYIRRFSGKPHRAGNAANDEVKAGLIEILRSFGLIIVTDESTVARGSTVANPRNIMARLPGTGKPGMPEDRIAFMLMAHYDSVPYGPGAADDMAGVAAILETVRAIKAGPKPANDIIVAFTDGEECGLLGAKGVASHPWIQDVGCMLNFEARGVSGPSYLFEIGKAKGWLVPEVARSKAPVRSSSLMFEVYRRLPFTTDFNMLRDIVPGMNIAFVGRFPYYHSMNDNPENLDLRSLQHHGAYALAFTRHFGNIPLLPDYSQPTPVWFSIFGPHLFWYPETWNNALTISIIALLVLILRGELGLKALRSRLIFRGVVSFGVLLTIAALSAGTVTGAGWLIRGPYMLYQNTLFILSGILLSAAAIITVYGNIRTKLRRVHLTKGAWIIWGIGMAVQTCFLPAGVFFWQWPLLAALIGVIARKAFADFGVGRESDVLIGVLVSIPVLAFGVPLMSGLSEGLAVFILPVLMACVVLGCGLILPLIDRSLLALKRPLNAVFAATGIVVFVAATVLSGPSARHQRMSHLVYYSDDNRHEAFWFSVDAEAGSRIRQIGSSAPVLQSFPELSDHPLFQTPADQIPFQAPVAELVSQSSGSGSTRLLKISISSPRGGNRMKIQVFSNAPTLSVSVDGVPLDVKGMEWSLDYSILPKRPIVLSMVLQSTEPVLITLTDITYSLPDIAPKLPEDILPMNNVLNRGSRCESDTTHVTKMFTF